VSPPPTEAAQSARQRALQGFGGRFGARPQLLVRAPGRVNLLGEHTDYNQGFVLPMAIERSAWIALRPRADRKVAVLSLDLDEERSFELDALGRERGWAEYLKGAAWALAEAGVALRGWEGVVCGDVPIGAGLSSSAALTLAALRAFAAAAGLPWDPVTAARHGQRAENAWVGVQCGIMDQLVVAAGREDHALLIDCRDLAIRPVRLPPRTAVAVLDTSTRRGLLDSAYNERRRECQEAARLLGVASLRDVDRERFARGEDALPEPLRRRARHVVTENARTLAAADALAAGDAAGFGRLMDEGHASLRDDFAVSSDALDAIVAAAREVEGCHGARMTGAGFAGCAVAIVDEAALARFPAAVERAYRARTGLAAAVHVCRPAAGASLEPLPSS
jgi:galactokinase